MNNYKQWLDNEYQMWIEALKESTVYNFKEHPMVKRMLGETEWPVEFRPVLPAYQEGLILAIDCLGYQDSTYEISDTGWRMVYYAKKVLEHNPQSIVEIGGGAGQFYATLSALGWRGDYWIYDLPEVKQFQYKYLAEIMYMIKLPLSQTDIGAWDNPFCISFYALGEFDDKLKQEYIDRVVSRCPHGFIVWNPHSGASPEINFPCTIIDEYPLLAEGNKQLEW